MSLSKMLLPRHPQQQKPETSGASLDVTESPVALRRLYEMLRADADRLAEAQSGVNGGAVLAHEA
jgi:DNA-binding IscR family transcriptional regulator